MKKLEEIKTYIIKQKCEYCKDGEMEFDCTVKVINHKEYFPHTCNKCGDKELYNLKYPYLSYFTKDGNKINHAFGSPVIWVQELGVKDV